MPAKKPAKTEPKKYPRFQLRVSEDDMIAFKAAAQTERLPLAAWIRRACFAAIDAMKPKKK